MLKTTGLHNTTKSTESQVTNHLQQSSHNKVSGNIAGLGWRALLLVCSGTAALIFQVLWIKQLTLIVGVDVYAVTAGVSAFFAGLGLGGVFIGRWSDKATRPLRIYAFLEMGVAVIGVLITFMIPQTASLFATLEAESALLAWSLIFLMIAIGPFLMGGTLPVMVRSLKLATDQIGAGGGWMYAANTGGAIIGALISSFLLIPLFGILGAAFTAASIGLIAAVGGLLIDHYARDQSIIEEKVYFATLPKSATLAIILYSVAGGLALGYEVIWTQSVVQFMSTRSFAFSVVLATYLAGLALGAALFARWADRIRDPWSVFGLLITAAGMFAVLEIYFLGSWLPALQSNVDQLIYSLTDNRLAGMSARFAIVSIYFVFIPTLLLGAAFPAALKLIVDSDHIGRDIGKVVALNTLGGIVGTVITGFVLVPNFGLVNSLAIIAVIAAVLGLLALTQSGSSKYRVTRWGAIVVAIITIGMAMLAPSDRLASLLASARGGTMVFYQEGKGGTIAVLEQQAGQKSFRRLYIQGVSNTGDTLPSLRYMRLQALLPLIIHNGEPKSALVIGLGTGITSGALLRFPGLEQRVVAELLSEVKEASKHFQGNFSAATDPRLDIRLRDGRRELLSNKQRYDLITLEPPPPSAAGVVNLYSTNFYKLARSRLQPKGIVAQWLPLPTQNDIDTRSLVSSFLDVYPHASLWTTELHEMLLVGSLEPVELNAPRIIERFNQPETASALREVGITSPEALLATWVTDRAGLVEYAGDALSVTDDQPRIEYADWVRHDELQRVLPRLMELRTTPPILEAEVAFIDSVAVERQLLLTFYQAALNGAAGHRELWAREMLRVRAGDSTNAYYNWFESRVALY
jgi:spermidine synthase